MLLVIESGRVLRQRVGRISAVLAPKDTCKNAEHKRVDIARVGVSANVGTVKAPVHALIRRAR